MHWYILQSISSYMILILMILSDFFLEFFIWIEESLTNSWEEVNMN